MISITKKHYEDLLEKVTWLEYLEAAGVDNWDGYSYAFELREDDEKEKRGKL